jgi:hypothetical protein
MVILAAGKTLGHGDLSLLVRDGQGHLVDPYVISYDIFKVNEKGEEILVTPPQSIPKRHAHGSYWVDITIPTVWQGNFKLVWHLQQNAEDTRQDHVFEEFRVEHIEPARSNFEAPSALISPKQVVDKYTASIIMMVRELLTDTNPDRNYHFRPPTPGKVVAGYTDRVGYIWTDETIIRMVKNNISRANTWNPRTFYGFTLETLTDDWANFVALGAAASCLSNEGARWAADEFSYSLNGVSIDLPKTQLYQGMAQAFRAEWDEWAPRITAIRPFSAGLRQQRWILG